MLADGPLKHPGRLLLKLFAALVACVACLLLMLLISIPPDLVIGLDSQSYRPGSLLGVMLMLPTIFAAISGVGFGYALGGRIGKPGWLSEHKFHLCDACHNLALTLVHCGGSMFVVELLGCLARLLIHEK